MTLSLKRETTRGILTEGAFDMGRFGELNKLTGSTIIPGTKATVKSCHTPVCMAGHIVAAAKRCRIRIPKLDECYVLDSQDGYGNDVALVARQIWANVYGEEDAKRLDFYGERISTNRMDFDDVTPQVAVDHIRGKL